MPSPGFVTPAPLTDSQQGTLVSPLMGQTYALGPPGLCFAWGGQFSPPYFAAGSVVCTGSSGLRVRLFSLLLWPSAGIVVSLFTSQASPLDPPGLLIALGKAVHFFSRCFPTKGELGFHPFRDLPVMQWEGPLGPPAGRAGASSPPLRGVGQLWLATLHPLLGIQSSLPSFGYIVFASTF